MKMKLRLLRRKVLIVSSAFVCMCIGLQTYTSFGQFVDIDAEAYFGCYFNDTFDDQLHQFIIRCELYPYLWSTHKGKTFCNISCWVTSGNGEAVRGSIRGIKFNWDNSITVTDAGKAYRLHVDRIDIHTKCFLITEEEKYGIVPDSLLYSCIYFYDKKENFLCVCRQKKSMPYKGKREGFRIKIGNKIFESGEKNIGIIKNHRVPRLTCEPNNRFS